MKPYKDFPSRSKPQVQYVLSDIDDTMTIEGRIPSVVFRAMEKLQKNNIRIIPITGRPAGWCDHIARMWPIDGLVGENGAFYFYYDEQKKKMLRRYWKSEKQRKDDRQKLEVLRSEILKAVPGSQISTDQAYREADLAIDFCEDVAPLPLESVQKIVNIFQNAGAQAKVSSIHVNGWFGNYDKLSMTKLLFQEIFNVNLETKKENSLFIGDSPNDGPMFAFFPHSVGVANVLNFKNQLDREPTWVTEKPGGYGFAQMVEILVS